VSLQNGGVFTAGKGRVFTAELRLKLGRSDRVSSSFACAFLW